MSGWSQILLTKRCILGRVRFACQYRREVTSTHVIPTTAPPWPSARSFHSYCSQRRRAVIGVFTPECKPKTTQYNSEIGEKFHFNECASAAVLCQYLPSIWLGPSQQLVVFGGFRGIVYCLHAREAASDTTNTGLLERCKKRCVDGSAYLGVVVAELE